MKLISWNVNGLRACVNKGFFDFLQSEQPDILCLQETKLQPEQAPLIENYWRYWNSADKKGYSGTAILSRIQPESVTYGIGIDLHDHEGRVITAEYTDFYLVTVYVPNTQDGLKRLDYRMEWEDAFRNYLERLDRHKPVIVCGDFNVAHQEIDLKNPKVNGNNPGFTLQERAKMTALLDTGFVDTFRYFHPDTVAYSWWSYRFKAREKNAGWRIDYFLVSARILERIQDARILSDVMGSDHCPVLIELDER